jgi:HEAT repeat protein
MQELLNDLQDSSKRREVAEHICSHPEEFTTLLAHIFDSATNVSRDVKIRLCSIVDLLSHRQALETIEYALSDTDSGVRVQGLRAIYRGRIDVLNEQILAILNDTTEEFEARKWAIHILAFNHPQKYGRTLRKFARNPSIEVNLRKEAIFALTNVADDESIGALCALLGDHDAEVRESGAWALSKISSPASVNCLLAALEDEADRVRDWAIRGLRDLDDTRALQGLADAMHHGVPEEQVRLIRLTVEKRSEVILRAIAELLGSPHVEVRRTAAWAMGVSPYPPAVSSLESLENDEDESVRNYAKMALIRLGKIDPTDFGFQL